MKKLVVLATLAAVGISCGATVDLAQTGDLALAALDNANEYINAGAELRTLTAWRFQIGS